MDWKPSGFPSLGRGSNDDEEEQADEQTEAEPDDDGWEWNPTIVTPGGEEIPPGACDGYHNKDSQTDRL